MNLRQERGQSGEDIVARHLEKAGYRIVARNWRPGSKSGSAGMRGEIDIIAWHGKILIHRNSISKGLFYTGNGSPDEAIL